MAADEVRPAGATPSKRGTALRKRLAFLVEVVLAVLFGAVGPILCFATAQRVTLRVHESLVYPFVAVEAFALVLWLLVLLAARTGVIAFVELRWKRVAAWLSGALTLGAIGAFPAGVACALLSLWPLVAIFQGLFVPSPTMSESARTSTLWFSLELLGVAWLATGCPLVYAWHARRARRSAGGSDESRGTRLAGLVAALLLSGSITTALVTRNAMLVDAVVSEPPGDVAASVAGLRTLGAFSDLSAMRVEWERQPRRSERAKRIAGAWQELRGWRIDDDSGPRR